MRYMVVAALLLALTWSSQAQRAYPVKFFSPLSFAYLRGEPTRPAMECEG